MERFLLVTKEAVVQIFHTNFFCCRDEHLDFTEYMEEQRELRGKGQKNRKRKEYTKKSDQ